MLLMIDNYDSFTYNLVHYFEELGQEVRVQRNDRISMEQIRCLAPDYICLSPGPGTPQQAGVSRQVIKEMGRTTPILGVCLGHQAIADVFGARVDRNWRQVHGKTSPVIHDENGVFKGLPNPLQVVRYHSLVVVSDRWPDELEVSAWTPEGEIMGLRHRIYPLEGVQFHPESALSESGHQLLQNFLNR